MATDAIMGKISFINHDKNVATIEYLFNGKKKSVTGNVSEQEQQKLKEEKIIKKVHQFHVGDEVTFILTRSPRGDKMIADCIEFKFNNAMDSLINKSFVENRLVGYLKKVEEDYFVKETGSYIFFPLKLSPWERRPSEDDLNEAVFFKLNHAAKADKTTASLYRSNYIPEYNAAQKYYKEKTVIDAAINKVTPHGIFVNVVGSKITGRISIEKAGVEDLASPNLKPGDRINIIITYLSDSKIVVERV